MLHHPLLYPRAAISAQGGHRSDSKAWNKDVLPSLHTYAEDHYPRIYHKNDGKLMFNEKFFLKPVE